MIAYSCEPEASSEAAVGWELASRLARRHRVTLITRPRARAAIEERRATDGSMDLAVEYHEMAALRRLKYMGLPVSNLRYLAWNHRLTDRVAELEASHELVHHTTWVRHWMPSAAAGAAHIPFVWGPVGAAERTPRGLLRTMGPRGLTGEMARLIGPKVISLDPQMRQTYGRVDAAVASSHETATLMRAHGVRTWQAPSVGFDPAEIDLGNLGEPVYDLISVGRLLDWKGFQLVLRALAELDDRSYRYLIVGDGPAERRLRSLAAELDLGAQVEFAGRLPRREVLTRMGQSGMLVHPSFHDSGGFVVVEALALGVPVVCLNIGGPPFLAGDGGMAVDPSPTSTVIDRLAEAMTMVRAERDEFSARARTRAYESLTWDRIVDLYDRVYEEVLDHRTHVR
jgi:glycosyltransferase involved in cell wall biosynthesis